MEHGKGDKHRWIDILPDLERELLAWAKHQKEQAKLLPEVAKALANPERAHVLLTKHGNPIGSTGVWRSVKRRAARAKVRVIADAPKNEHGRTVDMVSEVSPHWLRRTMATLLLEQGVHLDAVADILGHADTSTTRAHYTNPHDERRRAAMNKLTIV